LLDKVSRRHVLAGLGTGAVAAGFVPIAFEAAGASHPAAASAQKDRQWAMVIDLRRCDGCKKCTDACQVEHRLPANFEWIKVFQVADKQGRKYFMPRPCFQCESAPCLRVCPVAATFRAKDGVVLVDQDRCIGCRMCMAACPYGARYFNYVDPPAAPDAKGPPTPEFPVPQQKGTVGKCMFCVHRTVEGALPACVEACGMGALYIGDLVEDVVTNRLGETVRLSTFLKENDAFRYKEELNTGPRVYYIAGHGQLLDY